MVRKFLKTEGMVVFLASLLLFIDFKFPLWWLVFWITPDLSILGYKFGKKNGALAYNIFHTYSLPIPIGLFGYFQGHDIFLAISLIWLTHIGLDRFLGYGLKYNDYFTHTHLSDRNPKEK